MSNVACIDPGLSGTGIAIWAAEDWKNKIAMPSFVCSFRPKSFLSGIQSIDKYLSIKKVSEVYLEQAGYFAGSVKGQMVAEKQDLVVLVEYIGGLKAVLGMRGFKIIPIPVIRWKGTLPKNVVQSRILRVLPEADRLCNSSHAFDAVGIGLHTMGLINVN